MKWQVIFSAAVILITVPSTVQSQQLGAVGVLNEMKAEPQSDVIGFERRQFTIQRVRGKILIDGIAAKANVVEAGSVEIQLIERFDDLHFSSTQELRRWARMLRGKRTYTYDNVFLRQQDGSIRATPLVLLQQPQRSAADVRWREWLAEKTAIVEAKQRDVERQQAELKRTRALSVLATEQSVVSERLAKVQKVLYGHNDEWLIYLSPNSPSGVTYTGTTLGVGFAGTVLSTGSIRVQPSLGFTVRITAPDSQVATNAALAQYPGYRFTGARKLRF